MAKGFMRIAGLALAWALIYALPAVPLEGLPNLGVRLPSWAYEVDMWPQTLAIPGFIGGLFFAALLALTGRVRMFERSSLAVLVGLGAVAGLMVGGFVRLLNGPAESGWLLVAIAIATLLGAIAGPVSALVFRFVEGRRRTPSGARA